MLEAMNCPKCGAPLKFDNDNQEICFCSHCGTQVKRDLNNKTITIHKIDEAEIERHKQSTLQTKHIIIITAIFVIAALILQIILRL